MPAIAKKGILYTETPSVENRVVEGNQNPVTSGAVYKELGDTSVNNDLGANVSNQIGNLNGRLTQSFVEHEVGTYIDESGISHKMYEKTVNCGALPDNDIKDIPFGSTYSKILSISGIAYSVQGHPVAIPCAWLNEGKFTGIQLYMYRDNIRIRSFSDMSTFYTKSEVTVRYIKD